MRVLALGSRHYRDWDTVRKELRNLRPGKEGDVVVTGRMSGADCIIRSVCEELNIYCSVSHEPTKELDIGTGLLLIFHTDPEFGTNSKRALLQAMDMKVNWKTYWGSEQQQARYITW